MTNSRVKKIDMLNRYQRARYLTEGILTQSVCLNDYLVPTWIYDTNYFWWVKKTEVGKKYILTNASSGEHVRLFDHETFASKFSGMVKEEIDPGNLPIRLDIVSADLSSFTFHAFKKGWRYALESSSFIELESSETQRARSPDLRYEIFLRQSNLWLRELESNSDSPLTTDGLHNYDYGAVGSSWGCEVHSHQGLQVLWSPDSTKVLSVRRDRRGVKPFPIIEYIPEDGSIRPKCEGLPISLPDDETLEVLDIVLIDIEKKSFIAVNDIAMPVIRDSHGYFSAGLASWDEDSCKVYFVVMAPDYQTVKVLSFDVCTRDVQVILEENSDTHINLNSHADELPLIEFLPNTAELIWWSERSGWGHLYLYDLDKGTLIRQITDGDWLVRNILFVDIVNRDIFITATGRENTRDPYYKEILRVNIDTGMLVKIASSDHTYTAFNRRDHGVHLLSAFREFGTSANSVSSSGDFIVATRSRVDEVPVNLLFNRNGDVIRELEVGDISPLMDVFPGGWQWPKPVKGVAKDEENMIYGTLYRPSFFNPAESYPVIDLVGSSPDFPLACKGSFSNGVIYDWMYLGAAALAELGFIVLQLDGGGISGRGKRLQDKSYGYIYEANCLEDHVSAIKEIAQSRPYMDLSRVGISTHITDGGGAIIGMFRHSDFFKVGVNFRYFDHKLMPASMWDNKYGGVSSETGAKTQLENHVHQLEGKLMLIHGMNDIASVTSTLRIVEALHKSNKDFDLILGPTSGSEPTGYMIRRSWDYFVKNLLKQNPPDSFKISWVFD